MDGRLMSSLELPSTWPGLGGAPEVTGGNDQADLARLLGEHPLDITNAGVWKCGCGIEYREGFLYVDAQHATHLAEVVTDAGWAK